jgi:Zn-dependent protease
MDLTRLLDGAVMYLCFIPILTVHEWAHAWVAWKCGDDTARLQGRVSFNPIVHFELIGTVVLPLLAIFLSASGSTLGRFIIGWGRPVPVNIHNLRRARRDDTLVALAGPAMNIVLAVVVLAIAKLGTAFSFVWLGEMMRLVARLSLFLCFFNLLPIPPLDGSHVLKNAIGMSNETYWNLSRYGFLVVILVIQFPAVRELLRDLTYGTYHLILGVYGL